MVQNNLMQKEKISSICTSALKSLPMDMRNGSSLKEQGSVWATEISFFHRVARLSFKDKIKRSVIWEELNVESLEGGSGIWWKGVLDGILPLEGMSH